MALETSQLNKEDVPKLRNIPVVTSDGEEIGHVGDAYYDDTSGQLQCVGVAGDGIGFSRRVIPVSGATIDQGTLRLPYTRAQIESGPDWADDEVEADDTAYDERWSEVSGYYGGATEDTALTRSEEEVNVGTRQVDAGSVRLRKWVETEPVEQDVELRRETAHVTREPVDQVVGDDMELRDQEIEIPLHEEQAVVEKQTVAKERIGLETDVETSHETISEDVRKERVELEGDVDR
jgi:uncharacterized protein (TIGR02271 family)